jgi:hypothetical protein
MSNPKITMTDVIDRLFSRLAATYGADWTRQWAKVPLSDVKTIWCHELEGYFGHLSAIAYALDNLPERCPNVIQFRNLCRAAPSSDVPRIDPPKADPAIVAKVLAGLAPVTDNPHSMKTWAYRIKARHEAGERLNPNQIRCCTAALGGA